ncbi:hypothetical protein MKX08_009573 [Trichoderma sp. CBMAI-0020]|nr:hypothetical protein MKX08_009573 [Trichoderma sp. CBMAI-0020]
MKFIKPTNKPIRTASTAESASYNTNVKLKLLNFKTSTTITPATTITKDAASTDPTALNITIYMF